MIKHTLSCLPLQSFWAKMLQLLTKYRMFSTCDLHNLHLFETTSWGIFLIELVFNAYYWGTDNKPSVSLFKVPCLCQFHESTDFLFSASVPNCTCSWIPLNSSISSHFILLLYSFLLSILSSSNFSSPTSPDFVAQLLFTLISLRLPYLRLIAWYKFS